MPFERTIPVPHYPSNSERCSHCGHNSVTQEKVRAIMPVIGDALEQKIARMKHPFAQSTISATKRGEDITITVHCPKVDTQAVI